MMMMMVVVVVVVVVVMTKMVMVSVSYKASQHCRTDAIMNNDDADKSRPVTVSFIKQGLTWQHTITDA